MDWLSDGYDWPNRDSSRFVIVNGTRWHIQQMGSGPQILLLHGSGATTHSLGDLLPDLARNYTVTAIDLPGHGFTSRLHGSKPDLDGVSLAVNALMQKEGVEPELIVGHSAGAAIAVHAVASGLLNPKALVAINGAFYPFPGFSGHIFPAVAKLLFLNPFAPRLFAFGAGNRQRVNNLIKSTGSQISKKGVDFYQRALISSRHIEGTLAMMANWNLAPMTAKLKSLEIPVLQIIGGKDGTVDPKLANRTASLLRSGQMLVLNNYGHLVHEEIPDQVADAIRAFAGEHQI